MLTQGVSQALLAHCLRCERKVQNLALSQSPDMTNKPLTASYGWVLKELHHPAKPQFPKDKMEIIIVLT